MPDPNPRAFIDEYVEPAIAAFKADQTVRHTAAHALAQVDILAAVVANHQLLKGRTKLDRNEEGDFRKDLGRRVPILEVVRDAHDAHKHGRLGIETRNFAQGLAPETTVEHGYFLDVSFLDRPPTAFLETTITLADRTRKRIDGLLLEAMMAWEQELQRLGI